MTVIVLFIPGHGGVEDGFIYVYQLSWRCFGQIVVFIPGHGGVLDR